MKLRKLSSLRACTFDHSTRFTLPPDFPGTAKVRSALRGVEAVVTLPDQNQVFHLTHGDTLVGVTPSSTGGPEEFVVLNARASSALLEQDDA